MKLNKDTIIKHTSPKIVDLTVRKTISGATQVITVTIKNIDWYNHHLELSFSFCASILKKIIELFFLFGSGQEKFALSCWTCNPYIISHTLFQMLLCFLVSWTKKLIDYLNISTCWASMSLIWSKYFREASYSFFAEANTAVSSSVSTLVLSSSTSAQLRKWNKQYRYFYGIFLLNQMKDKNMMWN